MRNPSHIVHSSASLTAFPKTLQELDERIRKAKDELNELEFQRNLLLPICHLPAEVLGNIFTFCVVPTGSSHQPRLPNVVYVCRLWRTIAFNTPLMWSTPDFMWPNMAREMLRWSKCGPLNIEWDRDFAALRPKQMEVLSEAIAEISRMQSLYLSCRPHQVEGLLAKMVDRAPMLESVTLRSATPGVFFLLPDNFLGGDAPRLRRLSVTASNIPWGSQIMKNLTHLDIRYVIGQPHPVTTLRNVIETLRGTSSLEVVHLELHPSHDGYVEEGSPISLPKLRCVDVVADVVTCTTLLHRISFPYTTCICVECSLTESAGAYDSLFAYMTGLFASTASDPRAIKSLLFSYPLDFTDVLSIMVWNIGGVMETVDGGYDSSVKAQFSCTLVLESGVRGECLWRALGSLGPLSQLETMTIALPTLPEDIMNEHFWNLTLLSSLLVKGACAIEMVKFLTHNLPPGPVPFPALRTFGLIEVDFGREPEAFLKPFLDMLRLRAQNGLAIEKVVLKWCTHVFAEDVMQIRKNVHVEWDEQELYTEDEYSESDEYPYDSDYDYDDY